MIDPKLIVARKRSEIARELRSFFAAEGYLEVETPILAPEIVPESNIASFRTRFESPFHGGADLYLLPSPELWMKQLIAAGSGSIFQLSRCFRNAEQIGRIHNPEFTMLEWYTVGGDYLSEIAVTERLFEALLSAMDRGEGGDAASNASRPARTGTGGAESAAPRQRSAGGDPRLDLRPPFRRMSMEEAFARYAGISLASCESIEAIAAEARRVGVLHDGGSGGRRDNRRGGISGAETAAPAAGNSGAAEDDATAGSKTMPPAIAPETWESLYNRIFVQLVEPALPQDRPLLLYDFPANVPSLARRKPGTPWCERWELYARGCELANCYSEETDAGRVAAFLQGEAEALAARGEPVKASASFADSFHSGFPRCSGVALGFDRLAMLLAGEKEIEGVIFFPFADILAKHSRNARNIRTQND